LKRRPKAIRRRGRPFPNCNLRHRCAHPRISHPLIRCSNGDTWCFTVKTSKAATGGQPITTSRLICGPWRAGFCRIRLTLAIPALRTQSVEIDANGQKQLYFGNLWQAAPRLKQ
jgi:hypothetical protein